MKAVLFTFFPVIVVIATVLSHSVAAGPPDLPGPSPHLRPIFKDALIIPMDDTQNVGGQFNIKTYGLVVRMSHAGIPLLWIIRAGKQKDGEDFTANVRQVIPSIGANVVEKKFYGGPIVVTHEWADLAMEVILDASFAHGASVFRLEDDSIQVDVRHMLLNKPKVLLSNVGRHAATQANILENAGFVQGAHYVVTSDSEVIKSVSGDTCFTLVTEPHYQWTASNAPAYYQALEQFVNSGGNFLAQCAGIDSYENYAANAGENLGGFMTMYGIGYTSSNNQNLDFPNPDLPYSQFIGSIDGSNDGHTTEWYMLHPSISNGGQTVTPAQENDWWVNSGHVHIQNRRTSVTGPNQRTLFIATSAKLNDTHGIGSMVYYLGSHRWDNSNGRLVANGRRAFLNAVLTPTERPQGCGLFFCPEGWQCMDKTCHTCECHDNEQVYTRIEGCCEAHEDCGQCGVCNAIENRCEPIEDCCETDSECDHCHVCVDNSCVRDNACCLFDFECGVCGTCEENECVPLTECCQTNDECGVCGICEENECVPLPECCLTDDECGICETCEENVCEPTEGCCAADEECAECEECSDNQCTPIAECCSDTILCDACFDCIGERCQLDSQCCIEPCGECEECVDNTCVEIANCCVTDADCSDCQACSESGMCVETACGGGGRGEIDLQPTSDKDSGGGDTGMIVGIVVGVIAAIALAALLTALAAAAAIWWKKRRRNPVEGESASSNPDAELNNEAMDNPMFESLNKTFENPLADQSA